MKFGVISDIHGNSTALNAVLNKLSQQHVDEIICCGDIIGIGGSPSEVITTVQNNCSYIIKGNHDVYPFVGDLNSEVAQLEKELFFDKTTNEQQSWLYKLPSYLYISSHDILVAHSKPNKPNSLGLENGNSGVKPRDYTAYMSDVESKYVTLGHTHTQHTVNGAKFGHNVLMINPGSVGGVYQQKAQYAILDTDTETVNTYETSYDTEKRDNIIKQIENEYNITLFE